MDKNKTLFFKKTLNEFFSHLYSHSVETRSKFVVTKSQKSFNSEKVYPNKNQGLTWKDETPYFTFGCRDYHCHHGKDTNLSRKKAYSEKRDKEAEIDSSTKRYNTTQKTKKLDCPAHFTVYKVIWMPEYKNNQKL
ncbi:uncharacterized protein LOC120350007 isoform X2 [Nilaparvata lugens]|uniref:uncharacterized protein LOC120350007 isoform X2 n=1 Tax=Nilaparvata lugens TaxID=108931 RepID=UPI00193D276E|nr:uncharacterized protein LOC120350007 isoform X2 [Nilaparvata lugens]